MGRRSWGFILVQIGEFHYMCSSVESVVWSSLFQCHISVIASYSKTSVNTSKGADHANNSLQIW